MENQTKYIIKICTGTLCHVMGGAELLSINECLTNELKEKVELKGMVCSNYCKDTDLKPPFVTINDILISEASIEKMIGFIEKSEHNDILK